MSFHRLPLSNDTTGLLIDELMPLYDVNERHHTHVRAPAETTYAAVRSFDLSHSAIIRTLFRLRELPAVIAARGTFGKGLGLTLDDLLQAGFVLLGDRPPTELALGVVGSFWRPTGGIVRLDADAFSEFDSPGNAKTVWNFTLEELPSGVTRLSTETRVLCLDPVSRRQFLAYWTLIGYFSGLVRREMLRVVRQSAESACTY